MNRIGGPTKAIMARNDRIAADLARLRPYKMLTYPAHTAPGRDWFYEMANREGFSIRYHEEGELIHVFRIPSPSETAKRPHSRLPHERYYWNRDKFLTYLAEKVNPTRLNEGKGLIQPDTAGYLYDILMAEAHLEWGAT